MSVTLRTVLAHPSLAAARPVVVAGAESLDRPVRWVHTSEVLEIGMLLRGGELLLTGGVVLAATDLPHQRRYLRDLVASGVAGLAVEAGPDLPLPALPDELVADAAELRLPLIELRRVAPFVEVSEAVNGIIVNESVRRLRSADALSHQLSSKLAEGGGPQELLDLLADAAACDALLVDGAGRVLFSTCADDAEARALLASPATSVPVAAHGANVARLVVRPADGTDETVIAAVLDRAPQAFGIALVRTGAVTPEDQALRELLRALGSAEPERVARLARAAGLTEPTRVVGVEARGPDMTALGAVDAVLRRHGRRVLATVSEGRVLTGLVVLSDGGRPGLLADLHAAHWPSGVRVSVGPVARDSSRLAHTLAESARSLSTADHHAWPDELVDAEQAGAELLLARAASPADLRDFVVDQLGELLSLGPARSRTLVTTLDAYLTSGCSKTATARVLHLQRQALYQRLTRIFTALGGDPAGTPRIAAVQLACRLYMAGLADP